MYEIILGPPATRGQTITSTKHPINFNMSSSDSMPLPQRVIAISRAASATPGAPRPFAEVVVDRRTLSALAALCRHYGLDVGDSQPRMPPLGAKGVLWTTHFYNRVKAIAQACGGDGPQDTLHPSFADEVLDHLSIPALTAVATRYGLIVAGC